MPALARLCRISAANAVQSIENPADAAGFFFRKVQTGLGPQLTTDDSDQTDQPSSQQAQRARFRNRSAEARVTACNPGSAVEETLAGVEHYLRSQTY